MSVYVALGIYTVSRVLYPLGYEDKELPRTMNVIQGSRSSYGDDMGAFLCFMAVRLIEMRRLLKPKGSIYLHCDPTASHYLKELMDAIFGRKNFVNEVIWHYKSFHGNVKLYYPKKHDVLLLYSKTQKWTFNRIFEEDNTATIDYKRWKKWLVDGRYILGGNMPVQDTRFTRFLRRWIRQNGRNPGETDVVYEVTGQAMDTVWDIKPVDPKDKDERVGYPTQKPLALYERIIRASSNPGDLVLDPFAGCATTCVAAESLERQWVGIDIWEGSRNVVLDRMAEEGLIQEGEKSSRLFTTDIHFTSDPPIRTDDGVEAIPYLVTPERIKEPPDPHTRAEKVELLLKDYGYICQGCLREFDDRLYFELDHNVPHSHDGSNLLHNRILLCSPCNRIKSDTMTLHGLRQDNWRRERMSERANQMKRELSSRAGRGGLVKAGNVR